MGIRERLLALLSRGQPPELDPSAPVEIVEVPLPDGPMQVSALQAEGFNAVGIESFDYVTKTRSRMRILVPRREAAAALAALERAR